jgi:hypothetical protein
MAPSFTNLSRYDKDEPSPRVEEPAAPEPVLLRCNNCGATQRKGDWEKAMDARAKAMGSRGFVNLSASPQCLNCSSTDLVDAASPKPPPKAFPKEAEELTTQMMTAAREWEAAHTEAQGAVHLSSDEFREVSRRTGAVKDEMEKLVARLIAEARAKNILDDVLSLLQEKGARAALYIVDHYL